MPHTFSPFVTATSWVFDTHLVQTKMMLLTIGQSDDDMHRASVVLVQVVVISGPKKVHISKVETNDGSEMLLRLRRRLMRTRR